MGRDCLITDEFAQTIWKYLRELDGGTGALPDPQEFVSRARKHGIALVDPTRHRSWIDETVHHGVLWRLARAIARLEQATEKRMPTAATWAALSNRTETSP